MKIQPPIARRFSLPFINCMIAAAMFGVTNISQAAFIIEASDAPTYGAGHFAYTGTGATAASFSTASAGNLPATTDPVPTFFTLRHAYGGNGGVGSSDQYTFTYTPSVDGDNFTFAAGTVYNSLGANPDLVSSGLAGGTAGIYNVYQIHPANPSVTGGPTLYEIFVNGGLKVSQSVDQTLVNLATGQGVGRWELLGSVAVPNATDVVTVTMTPTLDPDAFVSMRASGIMFEYVSPIPEPHAVVLFGLGGLALLHRRRTRA